MVMIMNEFWVDYFFYYTNQCGIFKLMIAEKIDFNMKILVVEDQIPLLTQIEKLISKEGYVCETASDFKMASEKVWSFSYDLLVVDINLGTNNQSVQTG